MSLADYYGLTGRSPRAGGALGRPTRPARPRTSSGLSYTPRRRAPRVNEDRGSAAGGDGGGERKSILGQFGDVLAGVPAGIGHLGRRAVETIHAPIKAGGTVLDDALADLRGQRSVDWNPWDDGESIGNTLEGLQREAVPLAADMADSGKQTVLRLRHPSRYKQAWDEGAIVAAIMEDASNIALAAAPTAAIAADVGAAARAGGLARTAGALEGSSRVLGRTASLGGQTADFPVSVLRAGGRQAWRPLQRVLDEAPVAQGLRDWSPQFVTSEGRQIRREAARGAHAADRAKTDTIRESLRAQQHYGVSLDEQAAARALLTGDAAALRAIENDLGGALTPGEFHAAVTPQMLDESHLTPAGYQLAKDILDGTADPDVAARVKGFSEAIGREADVVTHEAVAGLGRSRGLSDEYITSNEPLTLVRERAQNELGPEGVEAARQAATDPVTGEIDPVKLDEALGIDLDAPSTYAARWRSPMIASQRALDELTARYDALEAEAAKAGTTFDRPALPSLPRRPSEFADRGVTTRYLPEGESPLIKPKGSRVRSRPQDEGFTIRGTGRLSSEYERGAGGPAPHTARTIGEKLGTERRNARLNETYLGIVKGHGKSVIDVLDNDTIEAINRDARDAAIRQGGKNKAVRDRVHREEMGARVIDAMAERGLVPWPLEGKLDSTIKPGTVDLATTPFLPAGLKESLIPYWNPRPPTAVLRGLKAFNRKFKAGVLPFSVRWQIGDAMSNLLMSSVGGVDPFTLAKRMREVGQMADNPLQARVLDQAIPESGLFFSEQDILAGGKAAAKADRRNLPVLGQRRPIRAVQQGGFKINEYHNRAMRQGYYLEKLQRNLDRDAATRGMSWDDVANKIDDPKIQKAVGKAVDDTATFLGDMANLAPFERKYLAEVMPFYPWMRHVTKLAFKLAVDHPARLAFLMRLGEMAATEDELPPFLRGAVKGPGGYWPTSFMNPLADLEGGIPVTPEGFMRSLSPAIKLGVGALSGVNVTRGGLQFTRPEGTGARDWYMREAMNPLIRDPGALAYQAARVLPATRVGWDLAFGRQARYDTGDTITNQYGNPVDEEPRWRALPGLIGVPLPTSEKDVAQIRATRRRRQRQLRSEHNGG